MSAHFTPALFTFLRELKGHNSREWFESHRTRFESDVQQPMLRFIDDLRPRLASVNRSFVADPRRSGGSMFRIYRDTRFSADKTPYKTHVAARFLHRAQAKGQMGPAFYLHLEPGDCFGGGGLYHPDAPVLTRVRRAIVEDPRAWRAVLRPGLDILGDSLTRVPTGFDARHPLAADLKRKDHYVLLRFTQKDVCGAAFLDQYVEACAEVQPLIAFLTRAVGLTS
jgi:uncharacterized protein (TIGR02453 family)